MGEYLNPQYKIRTHTGGVNIKRGDSSVHVLNLSNTVHIDELEPGSLLRCQCIIFSGQLWCIWDRNYRKYTHNIINFPPYFPLKSPSLDGSTI